MVSAAALDLTTSLRGDFRYFPQISAIYHNGFWSIHLACLLVAFTVNCAQLLQNNNLRCCLGLKMTEWFLPVPRAAHPRNQQMAPEFGLACAVGGHVQIICCVLCRYVSSLLYSSPCLLNPRLWPHLQKPGFLRGASTDGRVMHLQYTTNPPCNQKQTWLQSPPLPSGGQEALWSRGSNCCNLMSSGYTPPRLDHSTCAKRSGNAVPPAARRFHLWARQGTADGHKTAGGSTRNCRFGSEVLVDCLKFTKKSTWSAPQP